MWYWYPMEDYTVENVRQLLHINYSNIVQPNLHSSQQSPNFLSKSPIERILKVWGFKNK